MPSQGFKGKQFVNAHHLKVPFRQLEQPVVLKAGRPE